MRFKDRLRRLRNERGLTQKELGEAIFVSRSTVAKWENGLGLPSRVSYEALLDFFKVSPLELELNEKEEEPKIKRRFVIHFICSLLSWMLIIALAVSPFLLMCAVINGYGFTSKMAAGKYFEDDEVISTDDYDFYISYFSDTDENGELFYIGISAFVAVEKRFYGFQKIDSNSEYKRLVYNEEADGDINDKTVGILYSFPGDDCYYNIFRSKITLLGPIESNENSASVPVKQTILTEVYVNGKRVDLSFGSFFVTEEKITEFDAVEISTGKYHLTVK